MHRAVISALLLAASVSACGGSGATASPSRAPAAPSASANAAARRLVPELRSVPTPRPTGRRADAAAIAVIRGWSDALRSGDLRAAAAYFSLPSVLVNGAGTAGVDSLLKITTLNQAEQANETLPCGAKFVSADQRGRYVNALFRLTGRAGPGGEASCGGAAGQTARTNFLIVDGRIVEWIRAPDDPGDNGSPGSPGPQTSPGSTGPTV